ncbi:MAG: PaaI family thioesterase [Deltaproteobacteria bacterium]|nr:PaaI family thioesterase [Deltaproteobacteria bacterium]
MYSRDIGDPFTEWMGVEYLIDESGLRRLALTLGPNHMSRANRVHGGVLFSLLDTALGGAVVNALPEGKGCATLELKINYFRPIQLGRVAAEGRLVNLSRSTAYAEGEVRNEKGKILAKASGTFFITETIVQSERARL